MSKPYTTQTISGYNSSAPADDGSQVSTNEIKWSNHKTKLGDPIKTLAEAMNTELLSAFGLVFGQNISSHATDYTVVAGDQGKFLDVTGTTTITLLAAATAGANFVLAIINNGTGVVTVDGDGAETINGAATITLNPGNSIILTCNATLWVGAIGLGDQSVKTAGVASAVNEITVTNAATGNGPVISATGDDTNIDITLTPKGTGNVVIDGRNITAKPSFSVHKNGTNQAITTKEIVTWSTTEEFDTGQNFASNRFTPTVSGKYLLSAVVFVTAAAGNSLILSIYKNGSEYKVGQDLSSGSFHGVSVTAVVDANGSSDYFEIWFEYGSAGSTTIYGLTNKTYWTGCKID